jgi:hypothetical protein
VIVRTFRGVLFWFLAFTGEMVSAEFDAFWGETAKLSFMTDVLTSAALEWTTQSNIVFYVYYDEEDVRLVLLCRY